MSERPFTVLEQLDQLEDIFLDGSGVPFTGSRLVNKQDAEEALDALREALPPQISQADALLREKDQLLEQSRQQANQILQQANQQREQLLAASSIRQERIASRIFRESFFSLFSRKFLATCCVIVEPPCAMRPSIAFRPTARRMPI